MADLYDTDIVGQQAADRFAPSMEQLIDMAKLSRQARRALAATVDGTAPRPVPAECPVTLEELIAEPVDGGPEP